MRVRYRIYAFQGLRRHDHWSRHRHPLKHLILNAPADAHRGNHGIRISHIGTDVGYRAGDYDAGRWPSARTVAEGCAPTMKNVAFGNLFRSLGSTVSLNHTTASTFGR